VTKQRIDWNAMEPDWRAGLKPVLQLSKEYGVSRAAILKHWERLGVPRDLSGKIQAKADALVAQQVAREVTRNRLSVTEGAIVEANASVVADAQMSHRTDVSNLRDLARTLYQELRDQTQAQTLLEQLAEAIEPEVSSRAMDAYRRVIGLSGRLANMERLTNVTKTLIGLQREILGIDRDEQPKDPIDDMSREELEREFLAILDRARVVPGEAERVE
jgi:hypothetical protein